MSKIPDITIEQAVAEIQHACTFSRGEDIPEIFAKIFETEPMLAKLIGQAVRNWEGTKAVNEDLSKMLSDCSARLAASVPKAVFLDQMPVVQRLSNAKEVDFKDEWLPGENETEYFK